MAISNRTKAKVIGPLLLLIGIAIVYSGFQDRETAARLKAEGVEIQGQVEGSRIQTGRRGSKTYYLKVQYTPKEGAMPLSKEFKVSKSTFESSRGNGPVAVRYLASDPKVAEISGDGETGVGKMVGGAIASLIALGFCYRGYSKPAPVVEAPIDPIPPTV